MKKGVITLIAVSLATVAGLVVLNVPRPTGAPTTGQPAARGRAIADADRIRTELGGLIETQGLEKTYAEIREDKAKANRGKEPSVRHGEAHIFGELAYDKEGVDGIRYCDAGMTFGCYHGLIVRALVTEGLDAMPKIDAACVAAHGQDDTGCRHGIGHGLVEYYGARDLGSALDRCAVIQPPGLLGCTQGAFMEYANASVEDRTLVDAEDLDVPCTSVDQKYRPSCYFEQPYFWMLRAGQDSIAAKERCAAVEEAASKEACLLGFGRAVAELGRFDGVAISRECGRLERDEEIGCLAGAHWLFAAVKKNHPWSCDDLPATEKASCISRSKTISDVGQ